MTVHRTVENDEKYGTLERCNAIYLSVFVQLLILTIDINLYFIARIQIEDWFFSLLFQMTL